MAIPIDPIKLDGPWQCGWALDTHTSSSQFVEDSEKDGHFESKRPGIGELLHRLKYHEDGSVLAEIAEAAAAFVRNDKHLCRANLIVTIPPSNHTRHTHPTLVLGEALSRHLSIPFEHDALNKVKDTPELKNIDIEDRPKCLEGAFRANRHMVRDQRLLLVDDIYESGSTLISATKELRDNGHSGYIFVLAITKTRTQRMPNFIREYYRSKI
jgi:competence protein ComFC